MKVNKIKLHDLRNEEYFQFFTRFRDAVQAANPATLRIEALYTDFLALFAQLDEAYKKIAKSLLTEEIDALDRQRDEVFRGMKDAISSGNRHFNDAVKQAARRIGNVTDAYGDIPNRGKSEETIALTDLIKTLQTEHAEDVITLGLNNWLPEIKRLNTAVETLMRERFDETTAHTTVSMSEVRPQVDEAYYGIVERIESFDVIEGKTENAPWAAFMASLNTVIDYTNNIVAQRKGRAKAKKDKENGEENTTEE